MPNIYDRILADARVKLTELFDRNFEEQEQNAALPVLTALIRNFYCRLLRHKEFEAIGLTCRSRIKSFISNFLAVPAKRVRRSRECVLNIYTNREGYRKI